ncbi:MAG: hypothetical protein KA198_00950 [Chitinophagaceae bacterium]|nr:hypothetical protein [Chitinophagaceae bacterium]
MKTILIVLSFCIALIARAQQCGYQNHSAIIVHAIDASTKQPIRGLNMYLTYENGKVIEEVNEQDAKKSKDILPCYDPYMFWDNTNKHVPEQCGKYKNMYRHLYPNAGDCYICIVPSYSGLIDMSLFAKNGIVSRSMPWSAPLNTNEAIQSAFIHIKIEDKDGLKNGGLYATQQVRIPIASIIDICKSNLYGSDRKLRNDERLDPISLELEANNSNFKAIIKHDKFNSYLLPHYEVFPIVIKAATSFENETAEAQISLMKIELIDEQTSAVIQTIVNPENSNKTWALGQMEHGNFYNETNIKKLGFRVPARNRETQETPKDCFYYYRFNSFTKQYELDTLLNNKQETRFQKETKRMFASEKIESNNKAIEFNYELKNGAWSLVQSDTFFKANPSEKVTPKKMAKCYIDTPYKIKQVKYFENSNSKFIIDTFWISNYGNEKAALKVMNPTQWGAHFLVPKEILPNQKLPIIYKREFIGDNIQNNNIKEVHGPFEYINEGINIEYADGQSVSTSINYMIVSHQARMKMMPDSSIHFEIKYQHDKSKIVNTFPSGYVKEYGDLYLPDSCKIGEWTIIDSSETYFIRKEQHQKLFRLQVANANIENCKVTLISGWNASDLPASSNDLFTVSKKVKSILVYYTNNNEPMQALYIVDFEKLQQEDGVTLYLLKKDEPFFYRRQIKIPLQLNHQQYKAIFNVEYLANEMKLKTSATQVELERSYFYKLQEGFPNLLYYNIDSVDQLEQASYPYYIVDFTKCTTKETAKLFSILEKDNSIKALSKLQYPNAQTFCDNIVYIVDPNIKVLDSTFLAVAKSLGFSYQNIQAGPSYYQHNFMYKSKIVNEAFYMAFNKLCEANQLGLIYLNSYGHARPDSQEME